MRRSCICQWLSSLSPRCAVYSLLSARQGPHRALRGNTKQLILKRSFCSLQSTFHISNRASKKNTNPLIRLDHKDWLAPNEVLKIFQHLRDPELILTVFKKVSQRKDYKPNEALYADIIGKLARARMFDAVEDLFEQIKKENFRLSDEFFYGLIKIFANVVSNPQKAIDTLLRMPDFSCWPTVKTFNFVLNMLVCAKQFDVIHEVYLNAPRLAIKVDTCSLNILIKGLCHCNELASAFSLLEEFPRHSLKPNTKTYSTLMHGLCRHNKVDEAFELLERMETDGCHPDTITFNILISGLCKEERIDEVMELLYKMQLKGCSPNSSSYQAVIYGLLSCTKFVEAREFMEHMLSKGFCPSFISYKLLIEALCDQKLLDDAEWTLRKMVDQGFLPRMGTWKKILQSMFSMGHCDIISCDDTIIALATSRSLSLSQGGLDK